MNLLTTVAKLHKASIPEIQSNSLPEIFRLAQSPLLQVSADSNFKVYILFCYSFKCMV